MKRSATVPLLALASLLAGHFSRANEIGYVEQFSLADDRAAALQQLIPGTEDYYFYHCLHYQNKQQFDQVEQFLARWIQQYGYTDRVRQIQHRQALLTYPLAPQKSLDYLRQQLGLRFDHQPERFDTPPELPTQLDPQLYSRQTLLQQALAKYQNLQGFTDTALEWLVTQALNPDQRRHLLQRLTRPDYPNLARLVVDDLNYKGSGGFGSLDIHRQLLKQQLEECLELKADLRNQSHFVQTYISKLQPTDDQVDWRIDPAEQAAYLDRLWQFVKTLDPAHNSLKAHVLYHRLDLDRSLGRYEKSRFLEYVKLPRAVPYANPRFLEDAANQRFAANLGQDFRGITGLPVVGNDEPLVRDFLAHFFLTETTYATYATYIDDTYLKELFAETKIVNGLGDAEEWFKWLPPEKYQALKDRVDLDFAATNRTVYEPDEPISLDVDVKNVQKLLVKIYQINAENYYRQQHREVNTDIELDGLIANQEKTHVYDESPFRRVRRHFEFPALAKPGVYVIDFIGNGKSSRAVIRKGQLRFTVRTTAAGHLFHVLDESHRILKDARLWLGGHEYRAEGEEGNILVPFSSEPGPQPIVLSHGDRASLHTFVHQSENYQLEVGFYVDRESLLSYRQAQLLVRPALYLNNTPISPLILKDVRLSVVSVDHDGIESRVEVPDFQLHEERESIYDFQVPPRLARLRFTLAGQVELVSRTGKQDLAVTREFGLNEIDRTEKIEDLHFLQLGDGFALELLGKTGEPKRDRAVQIQLSHRDFTDPVTVTLKTDARGRIDLGILDQIAAIQATGPEGTVRSWNLRSDRVTLPDTRHGRLGEPIHVPYVGPVSKPERAEFSLLELRDNTFVADRFAALALKDGMLVIDGLAAGDYDLLIKSSAQHIRLRVTEGPALSVPGTIYAAGRARMLELRDPQPLHLSGVRFNGETIELRLENATPATRVHVLADVFYPAFSLYDQLGVARDSAPRVDYFLPLVSLYQAGRDLGDELRYILDRRYATRLPGNMLPRPELLLNPWEVRSTETGEQLAAEGEEFGAAAEPERPAAPTEKAAEGRIAPPGDFADLAFLASSSTVLVNLTPDVKGVVSIAREKLGNHQHLHIVAVDPLSTIYRHVALPETERPHVDLRLAGGLDPNRHYTQQKQVRTLMPGETFRLADVTSSRFEYYDSVARVYALFATLTGDSNLAQFDFVTRWPSLSDDEKRDKYSEFACHELNYFLLRKDPDFFHHVVMPYLAHKKDKTFLDSFLLGQDVTEYRQPWHHETLNIAERILLGQALPAEAPFSRRHVNELFQLQPPNLDRWNMLFETALAGQALAADDQLRANVTGLQLHDQLERAKGLPPMAAPAAPAAESAARQMQRGGRLEEAAERLGQSHAAAEDAPAGATAAADKDEGGVMANGRVGGFGGARARRDALFFGMDRKLRLGTEVRRLYEQLDKTKEWAENNYYKLPIEQQNAQLVQVDPFWKDLANHTATDAPFLSTYWPEAAGNFAEMMLALSVLDLPFVAGEHEMKLDGNQLVMSAHSPMILFYEEIREVDPPAADAPPLLVSQNYFRRDDRYQIVNGEQVDKFVTGEFLIHTVYGCQVVVTNPTSSRQKVDVLVQLPIGAIPVLGSKYTKSQLVDLQPYSTTTLEYYFYFPAAGQYPQFPVHVAKADRLLASANPVSFVVVERPSQIDTESWQYISQRGTNEQVIEYLKTHNVHQLDLEKIAFRMGDKAFFDQVVQLLSDRHAYQHTLWSYGVKHNSIPAIQQFLQHSDAFVAQCGLYLDSPLLVIDPIVRKSYQHLEYRPLVNARAHQLGRRRQILNDRLWQQYHQLLEVLGYRSQLDDGDLMSVTYYLLLQDRVEEAMRFFSRVHPDNLPTRLQYDYIAAYLDCFDEHPELARTLTAKYSNYPVPRWRNLFASVQGLLDEIDAGTPTPLIDPQDRTQRQAQLVATEPSFDFHIDARQVQLKYQNLHQVRINYYLMDLEVMFSRNPFVQDVSEGFTYIQPNLSAQIELPADRNETSVELPAQLANSNVLVEITAAGQRKTRAYYANSLSVQLAQNYGQLRVLEGDTGHPLPKVYVKAYARMQDGTVRFYKDGYTDLRGRFDYTSLNTNDLDYVQRFSLLVMSDQYGATVQEVAPPQQ